jgi:xanthine dehydrogenase small subunit
MEFVLNGEHRRIESIDPTLTVMRYLRETERLVGTKEGCAEGDCGACTAVIATLDRGTLQYRAVNTCIQFLGMIDGQALITIEHLKNAEGIHPVQEAIAKHNASQCGFCTPGFVMSLFAGYQNNSPNDRSTIDTMLAGNLCRCTGYTPIIDAAKSVLIKKSHSDTFAARERQMIDLLRHMKRDESLYLHADGRSYIAPRSVADLARVLRRHPKATIVAGATDVGLFVTKQNRCINTLVDIRRVKELTRISRGQKGLRLGAAVTYVRAQAEFKEFYPDISELIRRLGSVQVRNLGTIGGNIANGSPIGDMPPALIAAGALLRLRRGTDTREIALEKFFIAYGKQDRRKSEIVESVFVPRPKSNSILKVYKVSKRFDQDISCVCGAFHLTFDDACQRVLSARICFGGMAGTPMRARSCERFLCQKPWIDEVVTKAIEILRMEFAPVSDWRASAEYRRTVAGNLLRRCFLETTIRRPLQLSLPRDTAYAS